MQQVRDTSLQAYYGLKPVLGERQRAVYELLANTLTNLTNSEIARKLDWPINTVTPRIHELRKFQLVRDDGKRLCSITGRTAHAWTIIRSTLF